MKNSTFLRIAEFVLWSLVLLAAALTLYSAFCAFTWGNFKLGDYGIYTNMVWNSGHGSPFRVFVDGTYLQTHLSFSLALIGPLFRVWNHPFLLSVVQWLGGVAGALILAVSLRRRLTGIARQIIPPSLAFAFLAHPYTQAVLLCEFHGIGLFLFAVPLLYAALVHRKSFVAVPLVFMLGLREDSAFIILPMLVYFAVRDRWKAGYLYAGLSLLYGILALKVLFPAVAGVELSDVRPGVSFDSITQILMQAPLRQRLGGLLWILALAVPFLRRNYWIPLAVFPFTALLLAMLSPYKAQFTFSYHYPAAVMACLLCALAESLVRFSNSAATYRFGAVFASQLLALIVFMSHIFAGFLPGGGRADRYYSRIHPDGLPVIQVSKQLPSDGLLVCSPELAGYVANRAELLSWDLYKPEERPMDLAFFRMSELWGRYGAILRDLLSGREFGVLIWFDDVVVLRRGEDLSLNSEVLNALSRLRNTILITGTSAHGGEDYWQGGKLLRYWKGDPESAGLTLAYGRSLTLPAGVHRCRLHYRSGPAGGSGEGAGVFSLHLAGSDEPIASMLLPEKMGTVESPAIAYLTFELSEDADAEPRIKAGTAPLWLSHFEFF